MAAPKRPLTTAQMADRMYHLRVMRSELTKQDDILKDEYHALEEKLIEFFQRDASTGCKGLIASASMHPEEVFGWIDDSGFDTFMAYIGKTKQYHLVQRRVSAPAARELWASKGVIPGLKKTEIMKINLVKL